MSILFHDGIIFIGIYIYIKTEWYLAEYSAQSENKTLIKLINFLARRYCSMDAFFEFTRTEKIFEKNIV